MNRRRFLQGAAAPALVSIAVPAVTRLARATHSWGQTPLSPTGALQELVAGNQRFMANRLTSTTHDLAVLRKQTATKQEPFAAVLACADSRVPVELIFDQSIGKIFVARIAGNLASAEILASLEYAVAELGVLALLVLGHSSCGAVKAALENAAAPGQIGSLYPHLRTAVERSNGNLDKAIIVNAQAQADLLRTSSTVIRDAVAKSTLVIRSGVYDLTTGRVVLS